LHDDADVTFEWRLHPVADFRQPRGLSHHDLWEQVVSRLSAGATDELALGGERRSLTELWDGLECFVAFGDDIEPANLGRRVAAVIGIPPDLCGLVDHDVVGDAWERSGGREPILRLLADQLSD
jgi:hypothetical protein